MPYEEYRPSLPKSSRKLGTYIIPPELNRLDPLWMFPLDVDHKTRGDRLRLRDRVLKTKMNNQPRRQRDFGIFQPGSFPLLHSQDRFFKNCWTTRESIDMEIVLEIALT